LLYLGAVQCEIQGMENFVCLRGMNALWKKIDRKNTVPPISPWLIHCSSVRTVMIMNRRTK
jgi:hypothetical protein